MGLYFSISALIILALFMFTFFSKKRVINIETTIYKYLLILNFVGLSLDIITAIMYNNGVSTDNIIYIIGVKFVFVYFVLWSSLLSFYVKCISLSNIKNKSIKKILYIYLLISLFFIPFVMILPVSFNTIDNVIVPKGVPVVITYAIALLNIIYCLVLSIKYKKNIQKQKLRPIYAFCILIVFNFIIQALIPQAFLVNYLLAVVVMIMYFTIENPDIKMIEQLNIAKDQADKANKAKTDFLSNMSHEIRTPLNAIVGFSNLLKENKNVPEDAQDEIDDIIMASENLLDIVNGILDISKIEANKLEIVDSEYDTKRMLNELVALSKGRLGEKPIEFKTNFDASIPRVLYGDASRVKQICVNILTNAIKYTHDGWIEFKVSSIVKDGICRLIISVEDTGIGIKQENIGKLFNRFERLDMKDNATIEGTGLGLAITKKLLDLMGGKIVVQSVFGKGSKFTISIDQKIVKNPTIKLDEIESHEEEKISVSDKLVLLVDDNKINLKVAEKLLSTYGVNSESVLSGFEAIEKVQSGTKYDLILLDDMMPKMSGVETLQKLKEIPGFNIKTVALTANALTGMKEKYLSDGFDDYLAKPINKEELNRIINEYLNNK